MNFNMFINSFLLLLIISYLEIFNFKKISNHIKIKNLLTSVFIFSGLMCILFLMFFQSLEIKDSLKVFNDWKLYFGITSEIISLWLMRKNYEINSSSITSINFSLLLSIILVPIFSFYGSSFFGFDKSIKLNYKSEIEMLLFLTMFLILMVIYFFDKINNHVNNIWILILLPFPLSTSLFWTTKMMQIYEGFLYYLIISFFLLMFFLIQMIKNKEWKYYIKENKKEILNIIVISLIMFPLNILLLKILAVEFVAILKRISQVILALFLERKNKNKNLKDFIVILLFITISLIMFVRT